VLSSMVHPMDCVTVILCIRFVCLYVCILWPMSLTVAFCVLVEHCWGKIIRGQRHLAMTTPNDPTHMARGVHCTRRRFEPHGRPTANIGKNSQHVVHSMQRDNVESVVNHKCSLWAGKHSQISVDLKTFHSCCSYSYMPAKSATIACANQ